jgi:hypothetical protein
MKTKRYAPGPEPIFSAVTQNRPPPGTACREGTTWVFDLGGTTTASRKAGAGQAAPHR